MRKTRYNGNLYYLSEKKLDNELIMPKIPNNFFTKNGYEDSKTKRVCFCKSIAKCLMALSKNCENTLFYVYAVQNILDYEIFEPSISEVPDCKITGEIWIKTPVKVKYIGMIKCIESILNDGYEFIYGNKKARLYDWKYEFID